MENQFDINFFYDTYKKMSPSERKAYISRLRQAGINIRKIKCFSYSEAPAISHAHFLFDNSEEYLPYFLLDGEILTTIMATMTK